MKTRLLLGAMLAVLPFNLQAEDAVTTMRSEVTPTWPNVSGRWARLQVTTAVSSVPVLGDVTSETVGVVLLNIRQKGDQLEVWERVCGLKSKSLGGVVKTRFPPNFLRAISGQKKPAQLRKSQGQVEYIEPKYVRVRGAELANTQDDLPKNQEDPRIVDSDRDGRPGLTVKVEGFVDGDVYVVQRDSAAMFGTLATSGRIEGRIEWDTDQQVIGASREILGKNPETAPHPDPGKSYFQMRRVPRAATCKDVLRRVGRLFDMP